MEYNLKWNQPYMSWVSKSRGSNSLNSASGSLILQWENPDFYIVLIKNILVLFIMLRLMRNANVTVGRIQTRRRTRRNLMHPPWSHLSRIYAEVAIIN